MNDKWSLIVLMAFLALSSSIFFYTIKSHDDRLSALERILMGERGMDSRGSERE